MKAELIRKPILERGREEGYKEMEQEGKDEKERRRKGKERQKDKRNTGRMGVREKLEKDGKKDEGEK